MSKTELTRRGRGERAEIRNEDALRESVSRSFVLATSAAARINLGVAPVTGAAAPVALPHALYSAAPESEAVSAPVTSIRECRQRHPWQQHKQHPHPVMPRQLRVCNWPGFPRSWALDQPGKPFGHELRNTSV